MSNQKVWNFWAPRYKDLWVQKVSLEPTRKKVLAHIEKSFAGKTLGTYIDIGCGIGELIDQIESTFVTENSYGLDYASGMIDIASKRPLKTKWHCEDIHEFETSQKMDLVLCTHSFPYYKDQKYVLSKLSGMLNPDGKLLIAFASKNSFYDALCMAVVKMTTGKAIYPSVTEFITIASQTFKPLTQRESRKNGTCRVFIFLKWSLNMTNVLLIRPKPHKDTIGLKHVMICEPLELEYLVSNLDPALAGHYNLIIIDMLLDRTKLADHLKQHGPSAVLFTGYNTHVNLIKAFSKEIKAYDPGIITAVGGVHVEVVPDDFKDAHIDVLLWKNGIDAFNILLNGLVTHTPISTIQSKIDAQILNTSFAYNPPNRAINAAYREKYYYMFHNPCALIKTSFGCPFKCSFCFCHEITSGNYYERSITDVISELKGIKEREIYIVDDNFLFSERRVKQFIEALKEEQLDKHFLIYGRADFIAKHPELMAEFKAVGLHGVIVGIESVREKDLQSYDKLTTVKINEEAIAILNALDIECYSTLIIPLDFSKKDFKDLKLWLRKTSVNFVNLQPLTPLKGTAIYSEYVKDFIEDPKDVELWDMAHIVLKPQYMSKRLFYFRILKLYYEIVMPPKHLIRLVKKFGVAPNIKMLIGSSRVSLQYILKIIRG